LGRRSGPKWRPGPEPGRLAIRQAGTGEVFSKEETAGQAPVPRRARRPHPLRGHRGSPAQSIVDRHPQSAENDGVAAACFRRPERECVSRRLSRRSPAKPAWPDVADLPLQSSRDGGLSLPLRQCHLPVFRMSVGGGPRLHPGHIRALNHMARGRGFGNWPHRVFSLTLSILHAQS
jgi:hypothetical protein